jgi:hypothetical protein
MTTQKGTSMHNETCEIIVNGITYVPATTKPVSGSFWQHVQKTNTCWLWTGAKSRGYGTVRRGDKMLKAHRVALELSGRSIPSGHVVRHICRTPLCVRPEHLETGTVSENNTDRREARELLDMAGLP